MPHSSPYVKQQDEMPQDTQGAYKATAGQTTQDSRNGYRSTTGQANQKAQASSPFSRQESRSLQRAFDRVNARKTYDGTSDLMAIANAENEASLQSICIMLSYKLRHLKYSNMDDNAAKSSAKKIKKVMGKARSKIRKLQKEAQMEKKAEIAKKARQHRLQMEIRRELSLRRKVRKAKERKDVADSYMESQMEQAAGQATSPVVPDAVFTDLGSTTSAAIDILSGNVTLTDAAVTAVAEAGGAGADTGGTGGTIDLAL